MQKYNQLGFEISCMVICTSTDCFLNTYKVHAVLIWLFVFWGKTLNKYFHHACTPDNEDTWHRLTDLWHHTLGEAALVLGSPSVFDSDSPQSPGSTGSIHKPRICKIHSTKTASWPRVFLQTIHLLHQNSFWLSNFCPTKNCCLSNFCPTKNWIS